MATGLFLAAGLWELVGPGGDGAERSVVGDLAPLSRCHSGTLPSRDPLADAAPASGMIWVPGGRAVLGSERFYPEERPLRAVHLDGFWIAAREVTNADFARFVDETGYVTLAEREGGGSAVFVPPKGRVNLQDLSGWWRFVPGASWKAPEGPGSDLTGRDLYPVVHIAYEDAAAFAAWRGHDLPTEAEWEFAARGGLEGADYVWGEDRVPGGVWHANSWQGLFPFTDQGTDGFKGAAPVGCFPANGYGLYDMAGNVWEWTREPWTHDPGTRKPVSRESGAMEPSGRNAKARVIKGGSYLCAPNFCGRYRPAARQPGEADFGASHIGFRTVWRGPAPD